VSSNVYCTYPKLHNFTYLKSKGQIKCEKWSWTTKAQLYLVQETLWWAKLLKQNGTQMYNMTPVKCFIALLSYIRVIESSNAPPAVKLFKWFWIF